MNTDQTNGNQQSDGIPDDIVDIIVETQNDQQTQGEGEGGKAKEGEGQQGQGATILDRLKNPGQATITQDEYAEVTGRQQQEIRILRQALGQQANGVVQPQDGEGDNTWTAMETLIRRGYTDPEEQANALQFFRGKYDEGLKDQINTSIPDLLLTLNNKIDDLDTRMAQQNAGEDPRVTQVKNNLVRVMVRAHGMNFNPGDQEIRGVLFEGDTPNIPLAQFEELAANNLQKLLSGKAGNSVAQPQGQGQQSGIPPGTINASGSADGSPVFTSTQSVAEAFNQGKISSTQYDEWMDKAEAAEMAAIA